MLTLILNIVSGERGDTNTGTVEKRRILFFDIIFKVKCDSLGRRPRFESYLFSALCD